MTGLLYILQTRLVSVLLNVLKSLIRTLQYIKLT